MPERAGHGKRDGNDYYATTPDLARLICEAVRRDLHVDAPTRILEPGCGAGSFLQAIRATWPDAGLEGIEIHRELAECAREQGFDVVLGDVLHEALGDYDLIIGNPPFKYADDFIPLLAERLRPGGALAFILRLNFLAGQRRYADLWSRLKPARVYTLPLRPGFTRDGKTDATDYMVCTWVSGYIGPTVLAHLDNRGVRNRWTKDYPDPRTEPAVTHVAPGLTLSRWERRKGAP